MLSVSRRGQLCSCLRRGRELLLKSYQGGRVQRHFPSPLNSTIACQRHSASRGRAHWRGDKGLPCLPHHLLYCPQGQPSQDPWNNGYPFHLLLGNASTSTLLSIPQGYPLLNRNLPHRLPLPLPQQWLGPHLDPSCSTTDLTGWSIHPHLRLPPKWLPRSHTIQSRRRTCSSIRPCQGVARKPSAGIPDWCKRQEKITTKKTTCTLTARLLVTWWMFPGASLNLPAYYTLKSMRSGKLGLGGMNCSMPTML